MKLLHLLRFFNSYDLVSDRKLLRDCPKSPRSTHILHAERNRSISILQHLYHLSTPLKVKKGAFGAVPYYHQREFSVKHYLRILPKSKFFNGTSGENLSVDLIHLLRNHIQTKNLFDSFPAVLPKRVSLFFIFQ